MYATRGWSLIGKLFFDTYESFKSESFKSKKPNQKVDLLPGLIVRPPQLEGLRLSG
jgi:hypothetical protein